MPTLTKKVMIDSINKMAGQFGIPAIEFADESGRRVAGWKVPKPKSVQAKVHRIGGGFIFIKAGDRVHCIVEYEDGKRFDEGVGILKQVTKDDDSVHLVYEDGSFPMAYYKGESWHREFEKVPDSTLCTDFSKVSGQVLIE